MTYDLIIRNGTIVDGLGGEPYVGDVGVQDGVIAAVGHVNGDGAEREIDATGLLVTPGFVDLHTHYDGQAIWSERLTPSSAHGVTTVVMGNCGVGFAPCRQEDHDVLVDVMAGVEDIPGVVMTDGLPWTWETFPEYLDALDAGKRDIDVAAYLPHSPLRVYVMGQRGADREPATAEDLAKMRALAKEAIEVGALGFASSRLTIHKTESGSPIPSYDAAREEIEEIARGVVDGGGGLLQFVPDIPAGGYQPVLQTVFDVAEDVGLPVTFTLVVANSGDPTWPDAITMIEKANARPGGDDHRAAAAAPDRADHRAAADRQPVRALPQLSRDRAPAAGRAGRRDAQARGPRPHPGRQARRRATRSCTWRRCGTGSSRWATTPTTSPTRRTSIGARARAKGVDPMEEAYDRLLDDDGRAMLLVATSNLQSNSLDTVGELLHRDDVVLGLGDGGAHYGMICDASYSTYFLAHWARDRKSGRFTVPEAVRELTSVPARIAGLGDRGRIAVGLQGRSQRHRPRRAAAAQAGDQLRPASRRAAPGPDRRRLRRDDRVRRSDRRERRAHRRAPGKLVRGRQPRPVPAQ